MLSPDYRVTLCNQDSAFVVLTVINKLIYLTKWYGRHQIYRSNEIAIYFVTKSQV